MKFQSVAVFVALLFFSVAARAQTTVFTYQGQLSNSNAPANGLYDFRFRLFDVSSNVVAGPITNSPGGVTNGLFSATLNFGSAVFDGSDRWLEIAVRSNGTASAFISLSPLQQITSTPYAIRAVNAASAMVLAAPLQGTNVVGIIPVANLPSNVTFLNSNQTFTAANTFSGAMTATNAANVFAGNGFGLTSLSATNLVGTLPDARLSPNVAFLNTNANFQTNVNAVLFTGSGHGLTNVPGAFFWVTVAGTNVQAQSNVGYICTNDVTPMTITLPASLSIGDTFKVAGIGDAGWIIAQTNGQTIFAGNLSRSIGQSWKSNGLVLNWAAIASSSDGGKLAAVVNGGQIYTSTNFGSTWTARASSLNWAAIASSASGTKLVAAEGYTVYNAAGSGFIYTSTDSGANWTARNMSVAWSGVASSADGAKLVATIHNNSNGGIYTSINSGTNWTARDSARLWSAVASSADGTKLVATVDGGGIYTSINSGTNWLQRTNGASSWTSVASSSDGTRLIATTTAAGIFISPDSGVTWIPQNSPVTGSSRIASVASSADGARLAVAFGDVSITGNVYGSSDAGATWPQFAGVPKTFWSGIASSADGSVLAATVYGGGIYVSSQNSTTAGTAGYLIGGQHSAIELIYTGSGNFLPLNHEGTIRA